MNWKAFIHPDTLDLFMRTGRTLFNIVGSICYLYMVAMAIWHGFQIGTIGDSFYFHLSPLKRFF